MDIQYKTCLLYMCQIMNQDRACYPFPHVKHVTVVCSLCSTVHAVLHQHLVHETAIQTRNYTAFKHGLGLSITPTGLAWIHLEWICVNWITQTLSCDLLKTWPFFKHTAACNESIHFQKLIALQAGLPSRSLWLWGPEHVKLNSHLLNVCHPLVLNCNSLPSADF